MPSGGLPTGEERWPLQHGGLQEVNKGGAVGSLRGILLWASNPLLFSKGFSNLVQSMVCLWNEDGTGPTCGGWQAAGGTRQILGKAGCHMKQPNRDRGRHGFPRQNLKKDDKP